MENKILLQDLALGVSARTSAPKKDADNFVRNVFDIIVQYLQEDKIVKIKGLGTFKVIEVSGRDSVNVNTGERIHISGHSKISFTPDSTLRDQVNRPFADFETIIINDGIDLEDMERIPEMPDNESVRSDVLESASEETSTSEIDNLIVNEDLMTNDEGKEPGKPHGFISEEVEVETLQAEELTGEAQIEISSPSDAAETDSPFGNPSSEDNMADADAPEVPLASFSDSACDDATVLATNERVGDESTKAETGSKSSMGSASDEALCGLVDSTSSNAVDNTIQVLEKEKVVYIDRKSCKWCWLLYVLLMLAMMALSYLAGSQGWFTEQKADDAVVLEVEKADEVAPSIKDTQKVAKQSADSLKDVVDEPASSEMPATTSPDKVSTKEAETSEGYPDGAYEITGTKSVHLLKAGEGLYQLARVYYGNMNMAEYIVKYNNITNPDIVSEGTVIKIPELKRIR